MEMRDDNLRLRTSPIPIQRSVRRHDLRVLTSMPAGKMVPLAVVPLLREDAVTRGAARISFEMSETAEILMNSVNVRVLAYLVPNLAFDRFISMDDLNRAYEGVPREVGDPVIPYFETMVAPAHGANAVFTYMGKHFKPGTNINTAYLESYNKIWNFRARNRSLNIPLRTRLDATLAPAFWQHNTFSHIVPDFDQAILDGEVALNVINQNLPVKGAGGLAEGPVVTTQTSPSFKSGSQDLYLRALNTQNYPSWANSTGTVITPTANANVTFGATGLKADFSAVYAELAQNGITVSLSNIDMARRTQAFANLRRQFHGHSDEWLIDLLMDGISIPEQSWKQPILLAEQKTVFGMSKRYASDGANLTESVVNGMTAVDLSWMVPRVTTGGVVMIVAEITPEQLFERQKDPYLHATSVGQVPQYLRDTLDPEKVSIVTNDYVDTSHSAGTSTFGYAPLNHEWALNGPQIGGRFYRPAVNTAFDEARQRIWAVETVDPVLGADFYLCTTMHTKPFVVTNQDPFEAVVRGAAMITGNTVFGPALIEANNDYEEVVEEQPNERIVQA